MREVCTAAALAAEAGLAAASVEEGSVEEGSVAQAGLAEVDLAEVAAGLAAGLAAEEGFLEGLVLVLVGSAEDSAARDWVQAALAVARVQAASGQAASGQAVWAARAWAEAGLGRSGGVTCPDSVIEALAPKDWLATGSRRPIVVSSIASWGCRPMRECTT